MDTNQHDEGNELAGDLLVGGDEIAVFLAVLGCPRTSTFITLSGQAGRSVTPPATAGS